MKTAPLETKEKKLGKLLSVYRKVWGKSVDQVAKFLGVTSDEIDLMEDGKIAPSLPQLESLAHFYDIPIDSFLVESTGESKEKMDTAKIPGLIALRDRIIAVMIKRSRLEHNLSIEELGSELGLDKETLEKYESGKTTIPLPNLLGVSKVLGISLQSLRSETEPPQSEKSGPQMTPAEIFPSIPSELHDFVTNNSNLPYLHLAKRLSEMDAAKLREIAEGLLEITY